MKTPLQGCTESFFKNAYAARRLGRRDKLVVESLVVTAYADSRKLGRAALKVLRDIRTNPTPQSAA